MFLACDVGGHIIDFAIAETQIKILEGTYHHRWAVVVAQLVERSLLIPEVCGSNPVIGKNLLIYIEHLFTVNCELERQK